MKKIVFSALLIYNYLFAAQYEANLAGQMAIDSKSFIEIPKDAPEFFQSYGKFSNFIIEEKVETYRSKGARDTDYYLPFENHPIQGYRGIKYIPGDATYRVLPIAV